MPDRSVGDLAVVLHSHMPYVEGFGTFPFGEEWLFDAWAGSWLPVLATADRATVTVTPVLADQLEAGGVGERMLAFLRRHRLEAAQRDAADAAGAAGGGDRRLEAAATAQAEQFATAVGRLEALDEGPLSVFREAQEEGRVELMASAATHAVLPKLATIEGRRLQIDVGLRSHRRRFGRARGFWLPECAYAPGLEALLAERDLSHTCLDQSAVEDELTALAPARLRGGPVAFTIDWPAVSLVWSADGYPSHPAYLDYHRLSANGIRLWAISGDPYDPAKARRTAGEHAAEFARAVAKRLSRYAGERGRRGLSVFAVDTELLGHWWAEGPAWLAELPAAAERAGVRLVRLSEALERHEATERDPVQASWGEGKSLETWDSPAVADLAWGARRLELRLLRALGGDRLEHRRAERAARELLAAQSSDWAFMDHRGQAGDYPFRRATGHARALLEAIDSAEPPDPRMRNLAPDLSIAPLLEP